MEAADQMALPADLGLLERRYAIARQYNQQGVCVFDKTQRLVLANDQYAEIYGLDPTLIKVGMSLRDILKLRIEKGVYGSNGAAAYKREWLRNVTRRRTRIQDLIDGRCIMVVQQPTSDGHWITTHEDITERLRNEARITFHATRDPLTGLANRAALTARLHQAIEMLVPPQRLSVMLLDLDEFKPVNDTYGHDIGDDVLRIAAARIRCHVRDTDTVARLGGDEFVVIQHPITHTARVASRVEKIISALAKPFVTNAGPISVGASAGIALTASSSVPPEQLLKVADTELYRAKRAGRGTFRIYDLTDADQHQSQKPTSSFPPEPTDHA